MKKLTPAGKRAFKFLGIFFFITMAISGVFFYQFIKGEGMRIGSDVPRIDHSDYYNIEGKIYVTPWSSIPSRIKDADAASFRVLKNSPWGRASVGVDKNRVYCGEFALDGLDPARVKIVSPQYYSDGQTSYFCSYNPALYDAMWKYMFKLFFSAFGFTDYPQSYYFPFARLDTNVSISPLTQNPNVATDGKFAFYKGKILHGADIANLRNIKEKEFYLDNFVLKHGSGDSKEILTDGKSVFWDAEIIDFITSDQIYLLKVNFGKEFLYEPARGAIYTQKEMLDRTN
ncbi:MAG: DKNYY domain-containing protein [Campylobacter sp.]|nr:DKNYY domain-containing protein [Campylobacter sp.]